MYFKITNQLKRLCLMTFIIIVVLGLIAALDNDKVYADGGHKTTLKVVGASQNVQWYYSTVEGGNTIWTNEYTLGTPLDLVHGNYRTSWTIETSELKSCGPLTGILLADSDGKELQFIKAADTDNGLQKSDFPATQYWNCDTYGLGYYITSNFEKYKDQIFPAEAYMLLHMLPGDTYQNEQPDNDHTTILTLDTVTDDFDHVITLYFNGAENLPSLPEDVQAAIAAINAIDSIVTLDSEEKISDARAAFNALSEDDQALIDAETLKKLTDAEEALAYLKDIKNTIDKINAIGEVTLDSEKTIDAAQDAYDALDDEQKAQVTNYNALLEAKLALAQLKLDAANSTISELTTERDNALTDKSVLEGQLKQAEEDKKAAQDELQAIKDEIAASKLTVSGLKVTSKARKFTVTWKKNAKANGYQIQYKLKSAKKFSTLKTLAKTKFVSKKLKKGKKYQFRVRTYTIVDGSKVYGKWTKVKTVKCK